jgi:NAD(P)-dependent dehydrogenase (short-subunit alcohol dehydrogenase family)
MTKPKQIVIVGTSRGIGLELVKQFAADRNNNVLALGRNTDRMNEEFSSFSNVTSAQLDLSKEDVRQSCEKTFGGLERIDILINNAGLLVNKPFPELTYADISSSYQVNVIGVMQTVQAALPKMSSAHIVNISSVGGFQGSVKFPGLAAYSTSKAALCSFTELFAEEYKDSQIKMNCLCLGAVQTEMLEEAFPGYEAPLSPSEMATFIHDFAMNADSYMNGKIIPVSLSTP